MISSGISSGPDVKTNDLTAHRPAMDARIKPKVSSIGTENRDPYAHHDPNPDQLC
jgi:hypothetical protein